MESGKAAQATGIRANDAAITALPVTSEVMRRGVKRDMEREEEISLRLYRKKSRV
jgi:hypothetical protein